MKKRLIILGVALTLPAIVLAAMWYREYTAAPPPMDFVAEYRAVESSVLGPPRDEARTAAFFAAFQGFRSDWRASATEAITQRLRAEGASPESPRLEFAERATGTLPEGQSARANELLLDAYIASGYPALIDEFLSPDTARLTPLAPSFAETDVLLPEAGELSAIDRAEGAHLRRALRLGDVQRAERSLSNLTEVQRLLSDQPMLVTLLISARCAGNLQQVTARAIIDGTITAELKPSFAAAHASHLRGAVGRNDRAARGERVGMLKTIAQAYAGELDFEAYGLNENPPRRLWMNHRDLAAIAEEYAEGMRLALTGGDEAEIPSLPWNTSDMAEHARHLPLAVRLPALKRAKSRTTAAARSAAALLIHLEISERLRDGWPMPTDVTELDAAKTIDDIASPLVGDASRFTIEADVDSPGGYRLLFDRGHDFSLSTIAEWEGR